MVCEIKMAWAAFQHRQLTLVFSSFLYKTGKKEKKIPSSICRPPAVIMWPLIFILSKLSKQIRLIKTKICNLKLQKMMVSAESRRSRELIFTLSLTQFILMPFCHPVFSILTVYDLDLIRFYFDPELRYDIWI